MTASEVHCVTELFLKKMGLIDEPHLMQKTIELLRLLDLRLINIPKQLFLYGKVLICADIAANQLDITFDKELAIKLAGLSKSQYTNHMRTFEKLLGMNKVLGIKDICTKLNINEVQQKAAELLELYNRIMVSENNDIDLSHPQYPAMAIFYACKLTKTKTSKTKLIPFSNLKATQWLQLEQRWERFINQHYNASLNCKLSSNTQVLNEMEAIELEQQKILSEKKEASNKLLKRMCEDYESWKQRMLFMAQAQLNAIDSEGKKLNDGNDPVAPSAHEKENKLFGI